MNETCSWMVCGSYARLLKFALNFADDGISVARNGREIASGKPSAVLVKLRAAWAASPRASHFYNRNCRCAGCKATLARLGNQYEAGLGDLEHAGPSDFGGLG